jgi:hypothetical protein
MNLITRAMGLIAFDATWVRFPVLSWEKKKMKHRHNGNVRKILLFIAQINVKQL